MNGSEGLSGFLLNENVPRFFFSNFILPRIQFEQINIPTQIKKNWNCINETDLVIYLHLLKTNFINKNYHES